MTSRGRRLGPAGARLLAAVALTGAAGPAGASAWNRPAGDGLLIVDYTLEAGSTYFDPRGRLAPARSYSKGELAGYVEYGATDGLELIARPSLDDIHTGAPDPAVYRGLGGTSVGAQWQALAYGPAVLAVQGTFRLPGSTSRFDPALVGNTPREGEVRVLGGLGLPVAFSPFVDLEGSYRIRSGGAAAEWHGDITAGFHPTERLLLLAQSFTVLPTGPGSARNPGARSTRLGAAGVYELTSSVALQFGVFTTVWGRDALRARGLTTGIWYRF